MMWPIVYVSFTSKSKFNYWDLRTGAYVTKTRKDNDLTDRKSVVYTKKEIKLSWPIGLSAACDDN